MKIFTNKYFPPPHREFVPNNLGLQVSIILYFPGKNFEDLDHLIIKQYGSTVNTQQGLLTFLWLAPVAWQLRLVGGSYHHAHLAP